MLRSQLVNIDGGRTVSPRDRWGVARVHQGAVPACRPGRGGTGSRQSCHRPVRRPGVHCCEVLGPRARLLGDGRHIRRGRGRRDAVRRPAATRPAARASRGARRQPPSAPASSTSAVSVSTSLTSPRRLATGVVVPLRGKPQQPSPVEHVGAPGQQLLQSIWDPASVGVAAWYMRAASARFSGSQTSRNWTSVYWSAR